MKRMVALGIGASQMSLLAYVCGMATIASGSVPLLDSTTTPAKEEPTCFEMPMPDRGWRIIGYSARGGYPLLSGIDCTELFSRVTICGDDAQATE